MAVVRTDAALRDHVRLATQRWTLQAKEEESTAREAIDNAMFAKLMGRPGWWQT